MTETSSDVMTGKPSRGGMMRGTRVSEVIRGVWELLCQKERACPFLGRFPTRIKGASLYKKNIAARLFFFSLSHLHGCVRAEFGPQAVGGYHLPPPHRPEGRDLATSSKTHR